MQHDHVCPMPHTPNRGTCRHLPCDTLCTLFRGTSKDSAGRLQESVCQSVCPMPTLTLRIFLLHTTFMFYGFDLCRNTHLFMSTHNLH